jgi:hypothetical protein
MDEIFGKEVKNRLTFTKIHGSIVHLVNQIFRIFYQTI